MLGQVLTPEYFEDKSFKLRDFAGVSSDASLKQIGSAASARLRL
jgi:hypothetical protein